MFVGVHQPFQLPFNIVPENQESTLGEANRQVCPARRRLTESRCLVMPWPLALACLLAGWPITAQAADASAPVHHVDGSFVREWLVLGPFPSRDMDVDLLADVGGEANIRPKEGDTVIRSDGTRLIWTRLRSEFDLVNLEKVFGIQLWSVAYAYRELSSDRPMETDLRPLTSPSILWLNGSKVESTLVPSGSSSDLSRALPIQIKAGRNPCLLKLRVEGGDWVFSMQCNRCRRRERPSNFWSPMRKGVLLPALSFSCMIKASLYGVCEQAPMAWPRPAFIRWPKRMMCAPPRAKREPGFTTSPYGLANDSD